MAGSGDRDLRIAIVGLGKMGLLHACLLNVLPSVKLVSVFEGSFCSSFHLFGR